MYLEGQKTKGLTPSEKVYSEQTFKIGSFNKINWCWKGIERHCHMQKIMCFMIMIDFHHPPTALHLVSSYTPLYHPPNIPPNLLITTNLLCTEFFSYIKPLINRCTTICHTFSIYKQDYIIEKNELNTTTKGSCHNMLDVCRHPPFY